MNKCGIEIDKKNTETFEISKNSKKRVTWERTSFSYVFDHAEYESAKKSSVLHDTNLICYVFINI